MTSHEPVSIVLVLAVLTWWILRMVIARPLRERALIVALVLVGAIGAVSFFRGLTSVDHWSGRTVVAAVLCGLILVVAAVAGVIRARTVRVWWHQGMVWRQGSWITVVTWLGWVAVHAGLDLVVDLIDPVTHLAGSTLWAGLAVSLGAQGACLYRRAGTLAG